MSNEKDLDEIIDETVEDNTYKEVEDTDDAKSDKKDAE